MNKNITPENLEKIRVLYEQGMSTSVIVKALKGTGVGKTTVEQVLENLKKQLAGEGLPLSEEENPKPEDRPATNAPLDTDVGISNSIQSNDETGSLGAAKTHRSEEECGEVSGGTPASTTEAESSSSNSLPTVDQTDAGTGLEEASSNESDPATTVDGNASPINAANSQTWLLATNHQNMAYMLSAGMLMGPAGFGGKHYTDPSSAIPGWIPLFRDTVPEAALNVAVSEGRGLRRCVAEVDISRIKGVVRMLLRDGEVREIALPVKIGSDVAALLVPAPLPRNLVSRLCFGSEDDKREIDRLAKEDPTIDLSKIEVTVDLSRIPSDGSMLASGATDLTWPPRIHAVSAEEDNSPVKGQAIGGMLAMLYHLANRSDLCSSAYRAIAGDNNEKDLNDPILREMQNWINEGRASENAPFNAHVFWGVVQALVEARQSNPSPSALDAVLGYLDKEEAEEKGADNKRLLAKLKKSVSKASGLTKGAISDLLGNEKGTVTKLLMLLCFREDGVELLEFADLDRLLIDHEVALAGVLFGVRKGGWRKLPQELRQPKELADYVMYWMCEFEHKQPKLEFSPRFPYPKPLRDLYPKDCAALSEKQKSEILEFVKEYDGTNCILTHIDLPHSVSWESRSGPEGLKIVIQDYIQPRLEVDRDRLLKRISKWPRTDRFDRLENQLRAIFSGQAS
jgi:hypothetical protein